MLPLLLLVAAGAYLLSRGDGSSAGENVGGKELSPDALSQRFEEHLKAFKSATPSFKGAQETVARDSFFGDDDRARALAMAEFAITSLIEGSLDDPDAVSTAEGRKAAAALAIDYRDRFVFLYNDAKGALADALLKATAEFVAQAKKDPKVWFSSDAMADVDRASVKLVTDVPLGMSSTTSKPVLKEDGTFDVVFVDGAGGELGRGQVNLSTNYQLRSMSRPAAKGVMLGAYITKILSAQGLKGGSMDKPGKYIVTFAPMSGK